MKTLKIILTTLFIGGLIFGACKKYEEGPGLSLNSKKSRVANSWYVAKWTIPGEGTLSLSKDDVQTYFLNLDKDGTGVLRYYYSEYYNGQTTYYIDSDNMEWEFNDDKSKIILEVIYSSNYTEILTLEILKLKKDDLKVKVLETGDTWELLPE